ncbi:MAG TPA: TIGR00725 family protein [Pyrinomonadaceae bacterium]|nr:TIGR00725 family protein [Pyrinomonadaceae bacterium]
MSRTIVGVMGPGGDASEEDLRAAFELGQLVAREGWVLLTGGRAAGVMDAASRGAREAGGLTVGILPTEDDAGASEAVDIRVVTGMGQARNNINVLTSHLVVACGMGAGTASEVALALKSKKPVILLGSSGASAAFFKSLGGDEIFLADNPREAIDHARLLLRR